MSYGSMGRERSDRRSPFGSAARHGYQPVATQVSPSELNDVFEETSSNIFQINTNVVTLKKNLQCLGTSRDTPEFRQSLHSTQQQTNKVVTSTSRLIKQLSDITGGSSRQDRLRLTRLKTELSESVQCYAELQKKIAERSKALLPSPPFSSQGAPSPSSGGRERAEDALVVSGTDQVLLIREEDVEALQQREEALLHIQRDMLDVSEIMKDLSCLVHQQGDTIDSIEDYVQSASSNVESANQELAKADQYKRRMRRRKCCLLVIGVVVATVLIAIIAASAKK